MLSHAFYTYDQSELKRLQQALMRDGKPGEVSKHMKNKYITRAIANAHVIIAGVEGVLEYFHGKLHPEMGELLTPETHCAWHNLKQHVQAGCLCDPPSVILQEFGEPVTIGTEEFRIIRTMRGTSGLEGFHAHQKQWLGQFAHHAHDAGQALLADGVLRWNRKRDRDTGAASTTTVFDDNLLQAADALHLRRTGTRLYSKPAPQILAIASESSEAWCVSGLQT